MHTIDVVLYREGDQWVAQALNVDVSSFEDSPDEARQAIQDTLTLYFQDLSGRDIEQLGISDQQKEGAEAFGERVSVLMSS